MKIEYRKQIDSETAPWQLLTNIDELLWNGVYALRVTGDDGSSNLPFRLANDDTVTLVIKDHSHEGMLQGGRTIVQTITRVERSSGNILSYTRTRCNVDGVPTWNFWTLATDGGAIIDMPMATHSSLGGVVVDEGLAIDAAGRLSVAAGTIGEEKLTHNLNAKINTAATKANVIDFFAINGNIPLRYGALVKDAVPYGGTSFRVYTPRLIANGEMLVLNAGYAISSCKIFDGDTETSFTTSLNDTTYRLNVIGCYYQFEIKKSDQSTFTDDELPQIVKYIANNPTEWTGSSHIDRFITPGTYSISGLRTNVADGLPIANAASGHTFHARLVVLDSSITGSGKASDKCITQILALSNRVGGDGDIYVRTGRAASEGQLACGNGWGAWGKLQQNIEVGQATSLNAYIDNGIYSGVYTNGTTFFETFVMLVLNSYAIASATGAARSITQVKYAVDIDGTFSYKVRTGQGTDTVEWGEWRDLDTVTTARIVDGAVTAQKLSNDVREKVYNPLRPLYIAAGAEYNDSGADITKTAPWGETVTHKAGHYYLNGLGDITEAQMMDIYNVQHNALYEQAYAGRANIRTVFFRAGTSSVGLLNSVNAIFSGCNNIESIGDRDSQIYINNSSLRYLFYNCRKLRSIAIRFYIRDTTIDQRSFQECFMLEYVKIDYLSSSIIFADSPNLSKNSVLHMIQKAAPTTAITVTLHPDAYARLADDAEIVAALEAQPLISLVSA